MKKVESQQTEEINYVELLTTSTKAKPFVHLDDKYKKVAKVEWEEGQQYKKYDRKQKCVKVNAYSTITKDNVKALMASAHAIAYINPQLDKEGLALWIRDFNRDRCEEPFDTEVLLHVLNTAYGLRNNMPKKNETAKFLFNPNEKLTQAEKSRIVAQDKLRTNIKRFHSVLDHWDYSDYSKMEIIAEKVGVKASTIRSWRTRFPELYGDADEKLRAIIKGTHKPKPKPEKKKTAPSYKLRRYTTPFNPETHYKIPQGTGGCFIFTNDDYHRLWQAYGSGICHLARQYGVKIVYNKNKLPLTLLYMDDLFKHVENHNVKKEEFNRLVLEELNNVF